MDKALRLAWLACKKGEVPVGSLIVLEERVISCGFNSKESRKNAIAHAEMIAICRACEKVSSWRLERATLYSTLEPCVMCIGAIVEARISKLVFGTRDEKYGFFNKVNLSLLPHKVEIVYGVKEEESSFVLRNFFGNLRKCSKR